LEVIANSIGEDILPDDMHAVSPRILLVDDDEITASNIAHSLSAEGYVVEWMVSGEAALEHLELHDFDLILLDRMLPGIDGIAMLEQLQSRQVAIPIILLSALASIDNRVEGLDAGAQDYIVKPFAISELVARVNAVLRDRKRWQSDHVVRFHELLLDRISKIGSIGEQPLDLLPKEFDMLHYLVAHSGDIVTRQMLLEEIWGYKFETGTNVIDVHVSRLRKKIEKHSTRLTIRAERGVGYRLVYQ